MNYRKIQLMVTEMLLCKPPAGATEMLLQPPAGAMEMLLQPPAGQND